MEFGFGMGIGASFSHPIAAAAASAHPTNFVTTNSPECLYGRFPSTDTLRIDDLLDLSNHDVFSSSSSASAAAAVASDVHILPHQQNACAGVSGFSCNAYSHSSSFSDELYVPSEEAAQLEWLSKFIEDSFTDMPYPSSYLPTAAQVTVVDYPTAVAAPGHGARSRRSPNQSSSSSSASSSSPRLPQETHCMDRTTAADHRSRDDVGDVARRCVHCASEKTPQWRTGPLGPKTLCNACGVRYKSGRLVPEYRPAASPTFVLTQHSNSHRKVMELRRQKEHLSGNHSSY